MLRPGMYVKVAVVLPEEYDVLVIPATAVLNAPYSDSVFVIEDAPDNATSSSGRIVRQKFVRLGQRQGDLVAVDAGLAAGDLVVSTGAFKLRNGMPVTVDNTLAPQFKKEPTPENR
jgi:membrane fusion protein (multidrug efflux system)